MKPKTFIIGIAFAFLLLFTYGLHQRDNKLQRRIMDISKHTEQVEARIDSLISYSVERGRVSMTLDSIQCIQLEWCIKAIEVLYE